ncbi:MAG: tRNA (adenosine(37)-N6)-threonylcarbamoyltransferase complex dimerization subunit type 1 TsaB [Hyphomicrobiales bacterium]
MRLLALDTSMAACSAAVFESERGRILAHRRVAMERGHAEALAPMIEAVLAEAGVTPAELDRIAVTAGPGTFTGVRIGLAMARGLGLALAVPVAGIDTLTAIAAAAPPDREILVTADARNGEVYAAAFAPGLARRFGPESMTVAEAARRLRPDSLVLGTAAAKVLALAPVAGCEHAPDLGLPDAAAFAALAARGPAPAGMPQPFYLRGADATAQALAPGGAPRVRAATVLDTELLAALHAECFEQAWTAAAFADLMAMPGTAVRLAYDATGPLALLMTRRAADEAEIITVATRPGARRCGLARQLVDDQCTELRAGGIATVFLEVAASNAAARALYEDLGFRPAGLRRGYYDRGGGLSEDAVVMRRHLAP